MNGRTTITALHDYREDVQRALRELLDMGIPREDISLVASDAAGEYSSYHGRDLPAEAADISGLRSLVVGLAALDIPGIGPVLAAGPIASALIAGGVGAGVGAVAGGLVGALVDLGLSEEEAGYYSEGVRRGADLLTVTMTENMTSRVIDVMVRHNAVDIEERATTWREAGWTGYDPNARAYSYDEIRIEQQRSQRTQAGGTRYDPNAHRYGYGDDVIAGRDQYYGSNYDSRDRDPATATWGSLGAGKPHSLRLDTALPSQVQQHLSFELAVAVKQPSSPVLDEEDLDKIKSGDLRVVWPEDVHSIGLSIHVIAPECFIPRDGCSFWLYKGEDSPVIYFQLTPQQIGRIGIVVTVYQQMDWLGGIRLHTVARQQVVGNVDVSTYSRPVGQNRQAQVDVAQKIEELFTSAQLYTLCFDLGVNNDNLEGTTLALRARSLVIEMVKRGRFHELVRACQELRDNVDWEALAGIVPAGRREE
jgi:hypothetical protein